MLLLQLHQRRCLLIFLIICLCLLLCELLAAPATSRDYSLAQDTTRVTKVWRMRRAEETTVREGRMDVELTDYPDPGANPGHEPPSPTPPQAD